MDVYRIVELTHNAGRNAAKEEVEYVIEKRAGILFKRWKEVKLIENGRHKRISHPSYGKAEKHLMDNYTTGNSGIGSMVTKSSDVYYVESYSLNPF